MNNNFPKNGKKIDTNKIEIYTIDNFLSKEECQNIINMSKNNFVESTVIAGDNNKKTLNFNFRSSKTCYTPHLSNLNKEYLNTIDDKICNEIGINNKFSESIQIQYYEKNNEFKLHRDYFFDKENIEIQGQRTWTFMIYLNDVEHGGATYMKCINTRFQPKEGMALVWNNLNKDGTPNPLTLHSGEPVLSGEKYIITKWFREKSF